MHNLVAICQTNIISMVLMLIVMFSLRKNKASKNLSDKLFFYICFAIFGSSLIEMITYLLDFTTFRGAKSVNRVANVAMFIVNTVSPYLWALYVHYKIFNSKKKLFRIAKILFIPFAGMIILSFANLFTDVFFSITENNSYQRGSFYFASIVIHYLYLLYSIVLIFSQRKVISSAIYLPLLCFMILPVIGTVLQFVLFGQSLLWISTAISMVIIYNCVQSDYANTDYLTRVFNRKHLDKYITRECTKKRECTLAGLMIDLNDFKRINDDFGHVEGDAALQDCVYVLKEVLGYKRYLARYAGDEFISLFEVDSKEEVEQIIKHIYSELNRFNAVSRKDYTVSVSVGYALFNNDSDISATKFIKEMDAAMYKEKRRFKKSLSEKRIS